MGKVTVQTLFCSTALLVTGNQDVPDARFVLHIRESVLPEPLVGHDSVSCPAEARVTVRGTGAVGMALT